MSVDKTLNSYLGLPDSYNLDRAKAFDLYEYFTKLTGGKAIKMSPLVLMYYIDKNGDFTKYKNRQDMIVNAIFENMGTLEKFSVLQYIEDEKKLDRLVNM